MDFREPTTRATPRRRRQRARTLTSASLASLAVHVGLLGAASAWVWGASARAPEELVFEVTWAPSHKLESPPEVAPEPTREVHAQEVEPALPELVVTTLPELVPAELVPTEIEPPAEEAPPVELAPLPDASADIAAAMSSSWTPRSGSRANTAIGLGSGGTTDASPRAMSGSGNGKLDGTGSSSNPADPPLGDVAGGAVARAPVFIAAELIQNPRPLYPRASLRSNEQGSALLRLHVAADGTVSDVDLVESSGIKRLDDAAIAGVKLWKFRPATSDGVAIASLQLHRVTFKLSEAPR